MSFEFGIAGPEKPFAFADGFDFGVRSDVDFDFDGQGETAIEIAVPGFYPFESVEISQVETEEFRDDFGRDRERGRRSGRIGRVSDDVRLPANNLRTVVDFFLRRGRRDRSPGGEVRRKFSGRTPSDPLEVPAETGCSFAGSGERGLLQVLGKERLEDERFIVADEDDRFWDG